MVTITEDYVSLEVAKLLKEKGFLKEVDLRMTQNLSFYDNIGLIHNLNKYYDSLIQDKIDFVVAPTHQMAMKWLREKHDLHIIAYPFKSGNDTVPKHWCCYVYKTFNLLGHERYINETLNSYEEAVEAALKYCLENLI